MPRKPTITAIEAQYLCTFRPEPEGGYTVTCAAFPEIVSYGATLEEARKNAREAIELCVEVHRDEGGPIPESDQTPPKTVKELIPVKVAGA